MTIDKDLVKPIFFWAVVTATAIAYALSVPRAVDAGCLLAFLIWLFF